MSPWCRRTTTLSKPSSGRFGASRQLEISPELFRDKNVLVKPNLLMSGPLRGPPPPTRTGDAGGGPPPAGAGGAGGRHCRLPRRALHPRAAAARSTAPAGWRRWPGTPAPAQLRLGDGERRVPARGPRMCREFRRDRPGAAGPTSSSRWRKLQDPLHDHALRRGEESFGCIPGLQKPRLHLTASPRPRRLLPMLVDLAATVRLRSDA